MKGDFSRSTFRPRNHYSSVRMQQGRVHLDADWNEQADIDAYRDRTVTEDIVGGCGAPIDDAGFLLIANGSDLEISAGRYYVHGILCENEEQKSFSAYDDHRGLSLPDADGRYIAYLDVWQRHLTAVEQPDLREIALAGPDTTTRLKTVWQVKFAAAQDGETCADLDIPRSTGRLRAQAQEVTLPANECDVPSGGGYRRLENQLYRVEIHRSGQRGAEGVNTTATFKWSRDNGSMLARLLDIQHALVEGVQQSTITVSAPGKDAVLGFAGAAYIELTDEERVLKGEPGILAPVDSVQGDKIIVKDWPGGAPPNMADFGTAPTVRRWEGEGWVVSGMQELEDGVEVEFDAGTYASGDYWMIPARSLDGIVQWPQEGKDPVYEHRHGTEHFYCPLAIVTLSAGNGATWQVEEDCRNLFPPLTGMIRFFHVGGDGQEALPGETLPKPLEVGVNNGQWPVEGARVAFRITAGAGRVSAPNSEACPPTLGAANPNRCVVVRTDADGVARCDWRLSRGPRSQQVEAILLDAPGKSLHEDDMTRLHFDANVSLASQVAYNPRDCSVLKDATTVQQAIDILCQQGGGGCCICVGEGGDFERLDEAINALLERGEVDICICLLPGEHRFPGMELSFALEERDLNITIKGCGRNTHLALEEPWQFSGLRAFTLRDVDVEIAFPVELDGGAIAFRRCSQVEIDSCHVSGLTVAGSLIYLSLADRVTISENVLEAAAFASLELVGGIFAEAGIDFLADLYNLPQQGIISAREFRLMAKDVAVKILDLGIDGRKEIIERLSDILGNQQIQQSMGMGETVAFTRFVRAMSEEEPAPDVMFELLIDIRRSAIKVRPGTALIIGAEAAFDIEPNEELTILDIDDITTVAQNEIIGALGLYGNPLDPQAGPNLGGDFLQQLEVRLQENQITIMGLMGTLTLTGNQIARISFADHVLQRLQALVEGGDNQRGSMFDVYGRFLCSDNVLEGLNLVVAGTTALTSNNLSLLALPMPPRITTAQFPTIAGIVIGDGATYVGNQAPRGRTTIHNVTRVFEQAANLQVTIA